MSSRRWDLNMPSTMSHGTCLKRFLCASESTSNGIVAIQVFFIELEGNRSLHNKIYLVALYSYNPVHNLISGCMEFGKGLVRNWWYWWWNRW